MHLYSLAELPECQVPFAMKSDVIDQIQAIAMHPAYDCYTAKVSVELILYLTQSPETHIYIIRREVVESMLEICEQRNKMINLQSSQSHRRNRKDPMVVNVLKYVHTFMHILCTPHAHFLSHILYFFSGAIPALCWLKLDLVHLIFCLIPFHLTFCNRFSN